MCKNAESTALTLAEGIEPTVIQILTLEGLASSTEGQAAINAFNTLITSLKTWQPGTGAQDVIQAIDAFTTVFNVLPFPDTDKTLVDIVVAGVTTLIGILTANSPAPAPPAGQTITAALKCSSRPMPARLRLILPPRWQPSSQASSARAFIPPNGNTGRHGTQQ